MTKARDLGDFISDGTIAETVTADGLNLGDNEKIQLGDSQDLQIYHQGSASYITDQGSGNLVLGAADSIIFQNAAHNENMLVASQNGAVSLYHDNAVKFATSATGATVTGTIAVSDSFNATSGTFTVQSNGTDILNVTSTEMTPQTDGAISLGSATNGFNNMHLDGTAHIAGNINVGKGAGSADVQIEVGVNRTADGNAYIDLHAESGADYSGRLLRSSGTNGALSLSNKGSGTVSVGVEGAGIVITKTNDTERTRITSDGKFGVNTTAPATMIESVGTAGINPLQLSAPKEIFTRIRRTDAGADSNYIGNFIFTAQNDASVEKEYAKILVQQTNVEAGNEDGSLVIQAAKDGSLFSAIVVDGNSDLLSLRTSSGEKFRIASSGELGIGGANYGTSGQVLTSGGSGAAPTWAAVAAGAPFSGFGS
jgi:hypothetical protein